MKAPHLCIVTSVHPLDDVRVKTKFVNSFLEMGWRVSWVGPDSAIHDNGSAHDPRVEYALVPKPAGKLGRLRAAAPLHAAASDVGDVDWWYSPDPDAVRVALRLARARGGRVIFDIHEVFHTGHLDQWTGGRRVRPLSFLVRKRIQSSCRRADLVVAVSEGVLAHYSRKLLTASVVVRNCAPRSFAQTRSGRAVQAELRVMHGKMATGNGTAAVLQALGHLIPAHSRIRLLMFETADSDSLIREHLAEVPDLVSIDQLTRVPHEEMPQITQGCDLGLISYQRDLGTESMPNRVFEYMACGIAVLVPEYSTDLRNLVLREEIGLSCDFESPRSIADRILWMANNPSEVEAMGRRARLAFLDRHCWETEFETFRDELSRIESGQ